MSDQINNVNLDNLKSFSQAAAQDPAKAVKTQVVEAEWRTEGGSPQMTATVKFEKGEAVFELDNPSFMGGTGMNPGPFHYCFFGLAACYTGVFASTASMMGIRLKSLRVRVEADIRFERALGLEGPPPMEEVRVTLTVSSDDPPEKIREAEELALRRCPVVYTLRNPIRLTPHIVV